MPVAALIIQDETGEVVGADGYFDVSAIRAYFDNLGDTVFEGESDDVVTVCGRRATQFFDVVWGPRAPGAPTYEDQTTIYPRDDKPFPAKLLACICELAKMAKDGPLGGQGAVVNAPSAAQIAKMKAGSVEIEFGSSTKAAIETDVADRFFLIEKLASTFLRSGALNTGSSR